MRNWICSASVWLWHGFWSHLYFRVCVSSVRSGSRVIHRPCSPAVPSCTIAQSTIEEMKCSPDRSGSPTPRTYRLLPINFRFVKLNHHLLGVVWLSAYSRWCNLTANSCLTCPKYWRMTSASWRSRGASKAWFSGKLGSPGMANCSRAPLMRAFSAVRASALDFTFVRQSETNRMPYISRRSAGPLISKLRKKVLARKSERTSSRMS